MMKESNKKHVYNSISSENDIMYEAKDDYFITINNDDNLILTSLFLPINVNYDIENIENPYLFSVPEQGFYTHL